MEIPEDVGGGEGADLACAESRGVHELEDGAVAVVDDRVGGARGVGEPIARVPDLGAAGFGELVGIGLGLLEPLRLALPVGDAARRVCGQPRAARDVLVGQSISARLGEKVAVELGRAARRVLPRREIPGQGFD